MVFDFHPPPLASFNFVRLELSEKQKVGEEKGREKEKKEKTKERAGREGWGRRESRGRKGNRRTSTPPHLRLSLSLSLSLLFARMPQGEREKGKREKGKKCAH